jgi:hypothetical protein
MVVRRTNFRTSLSVLSVHLKLCRYFSILSGGQALSVLSVLLIEFTRESPAADKRTDKLVRFVRRPVRCAILRRSRPRACEVTKRPWSRR